MKYSIEQAIKILHIKGRPKLTCDNIIDYIAIGKLIFYVRHCNWIGKDNIHNITVKNQKIWSDNSTDNIQNIEIIRKAVKTKTRFKLILCEKIRDEAALKRVDMEKYMPKPIDAYTIFNGNRILIKKLGINSKGVIVLLTDKNKSECTNLLEFFSSNLPDYKIEKFKQQFPLRHRKIGPYESTIEENTLYSDKISLKDIYFEQEDIEALLKNESPVQKIKQLEALIEQQQNEINQLKKDLSKQKTINKLNDNADNWRLAFSYKSVWLDAMYDMMEEYYFDDNDSQIDIKDLPYKDSIESKVLSNLIKREADKIITSGQRKGKNIKK